MEYEPWKVVTGILASIALVADHVGRDRTLKIIDMIGLKRGDNGVSASVPQRLSMGNCGSDTGSGDYEPIRIHRAPSGQVIPLHLVEETRPVTEQPRATVATTSFITPGEMSLFAAPGGASVDIIPPPGMLTTMNVEVISSGTYVMVSGETASSSLRTLIVDPVVRPHLLSILGARGDRLSKGMLITFQSSAEACDAFKGLVGALYTGYIHNHDIRFLAVLEW